MLPKQKRGFVSLSFTIEPTAEANALSYIEIKNSVLLVCIGLVFLSPFTSLDFLSFLQNIVVGSRIKSVQLYLLIAIP